MYRPPSRRRKKKGDKGLNLVPILDAVFIFIFFLLTSSNFISIYEIVSNVPILSSKSPPPKKKPFYMTLKIYTRHMDIYLGTPNTLRKRFANKNDGTYDVDQLHQYLIGIKKRYLKEKSIIFEPIADIEYEALIKIMDSVQNFKNTDPNLYIKDKNGMDVKVKELFSDVIFGNIQT